MNLGQVASKVLTDASALKGTPAANEANTKALLIEPLLSALGWPMSDVSRVTREYRVFDGTFLDYALMLEGKPRLFVEAKALGESLDNKQFIAQTVNYANNEGVVWCVLTNGITYRVYKTNEPVSMSQKLLFEVSLDDVGGGGSKSASASLERISPASVSSDALDSWGEQIFADARVRDALATLAQKPPSALVEVVSKKLDKPPLSDELLRSSLQRVLGSTHSVVAGPKIGGTQQKHGATQTKGKNTEYTVEHHTNGKPTLIVDLFEQIDAFGMNLGTDVSRRLRKNYVGYFAGKQSFFTAELQKTRVWVYLRLDPSDPSVWIEGVMRDVRDIGHFGLGDTEFDLKSREQLGSVRDLIQAAY